MILVSEDELAVKTLDHIYCVLTFILNNQYVYVFQQSLAMTIVNLAQNFVGSNNLNLLMPIGQFGTRIHGGKDSASARYIFTKLSPLARLVFPQHDDNVLNFLVEDNQMIEPEWYCPIIPMALVNGADGIGTGYSTKIPNFDVRQLAQYIKDLLQDREPQPLVRLLVSLA